jgi:hypothetical protein
MAFDGGLGEVRDLGIRDRDRIGEMVGEAAEASAEDDSDSGSKCGAPADEGGGAFRFVEG